MEINDAPSQVKRAQPSLLPKQTARKIALVALPIVLLLFVMQAARKKPRPFPGLGGVVTSIAYAPDGTLVCASSNGMVQKWMPGIGKWRSFRLRSYVMGPTGFSKLRFSPDGKSLYSGGLIALPSAGQPSSVAIAWDTKSRGHIQALNLVTNQAFDVSADGKTAAFGFGDSVSICPVEPDAKSRTPNEGYLQSSRNINASMPMDLCLSPDGKYLAICDTSASIGIFDARSAKNVGRVPQLSAGFNTSVSALSWSPDGRWIAICASTGAGSPSDSLALWDTRTQQVKQVALERVAASISVMPLGRTIAWAPDSSRLAIGGPDARLFSVPDLTQERAFAGAGGVAFSPDGRTLATGHATEPTVFEWHL